MIALLFILVTPAFAAPSPTPDIKSGTYDLPNYNQAKLPSISTCDPKSVDDDGNIPSMGNTYIDAVTSTAVKLNKTYGKKSGAPASDEDDEDVDGKATLETDCGRGSDKLGIDPEKVSCSVKNQLEDFRKKRNDSQKFLACKRGVLDALRGEIGCFKKQIADAEGFMNELVGGPGGLAEMLNKGNNDLTQIDQEVQDRQSQYTAANERVEGGEGGNPPGLRQAKDMIAKLSAELPVQVTKVNQQVETLRNQQARFETLVGQLAMGRAMACLNAPAEGYRCVKTGTSSSNHPDWNGTVSPLTYLQCLYAQSANRVAGGSVIKNPAREAALLKAAQSAFAQAGTKVPSATDLPDFSDKAAFTASMKVYPVKTPADLIKLLTPTLQGMDSTTGKAMTAQFTASLNTCYATAKKEVEEERKDSNSQIKMSETALKQSFETTKSANAGAFRELRENYAKVVKAATGQSVNVNTERCEKASLEDQAKCFDAFNAMTDSLLTGKVVSSATALTGPAQALTNGQAPIHGFTGSLAAKNMPQRSIPVQCLGIDDCLTKYTNLRTQLKQVVDERTKFKESYKTQVNSRLAMTAKELASKGTTGVGQAGIQPGTITLNTLAAGIKSRKTQLETAMSKFGVDAGLDLDPKEVKEPAKDEATGLYRASDLKNLVLAEITPGLPDANSKGFTDTLKAVRERDTELEKAQDKLDTDFAAIEAKISECSATANTKKCDQMSKLLEACVKAAEMDPVYQACKTAREMANNLAAEKTVRTEAYKKSQVAECLTTATQCGVKPESILAACSVGTDGEAVSENQDKGNQATGKNSTDSKKAKTGN